MGYAFWKKARFLCMRAVVLLLVVVLSFIDLGRVLTIVSLPETVETAHAAAGDFSIFRNQSNATSVPTGGSEVEVLWDTIESEDSNIALQAGSTTIDLAEGGKYLVLYNVWTEETGGGQEFRRSFETYLTLNESEIAYGRGDGYIRDNNGDDQYAYAAGGTIIDATADDDLEINIARDDANSDDNTQTRTGTNGVSVLKLREDLDYLRVYKDTRSADISGDTTFTNVLWDQSDEVDTGSFAFTDGSGDITLVGDQGDYFLVTTNVRLNQDANSNTRQNYEMRLTLDNVEIPGTRSTAYLRGNQNGNGIFNGTLVYTGLVRKTSASDETLNVEVRREPTTQSASTDIVANETALSIVALPSSGNYVSLTSASNQALPSSQSPIDFDEQFEVESGAFSHSTTSFPSRINIDADGDYLFFSTLYATRTSSGDRDPIRIEWRLDGSDTVEYGGHGSFNRGDQGSSDAFTAGSSGGILLPNLTSSQYIEVTAFDEEDTGQSTFNARHIAVQGLELASLAQINVTVSATGTHTGVSRIPTADVYQGGSFIITDNTGSRSINNIVLTESGTVDASTGLNNIEVWYDLSTTSPYSCSEHSFDGNEAQFGSTDTNGFSGANGTASFSDSVSLSTTQTFCGYVVYDVTTSANDGETAIISIDDPTTDVVLTSGTLEPDTPVAPAGSTALADAELTQIHYHWRNDDGSDETDATSATGNTEDTPLGALQASTTRRLRMEVSNEGSIESADIVNILDAFSTSSSRTISAGSNRLFVVGIHSEHSSAGVDVNTVSFGGQTLTEVGEMQIGTGFSNSMWVGYLDEAGIQAASGNTITPTWNTGPPDQELMYSSVVFENVNQSNPVPNWSGNTAANAATVQPTTTIPVSAGDIAVYFTTSGDVTNPHTPATDYTEGTEEVGPTSNQATAANAYRAIYADGSEQPTANWGGSTNRLSIVALNVNAVTSSFSPQQYRLEYAERISTCSAATGWTDVGAALGDWDMVDSANLTDGEDTTNIASASNGAVTDEAGSFLTPNAAVKDTSSETGGMVLDTNTFVELEYSVEARATAVEGTTYCFRLTDAGTPLKNYDVYPEATINADVIVSATGTQVASVNESSTNNYMGGAFVIQANTGSPNVTSIMLTEVGTVDAQTSLENIRLYYDLDTTGGDGFDCSDQSYGGTEPQFGATSTSFSNANGTTTFSGSVGISTSQSMCVYAVLDVNATSTSGETIDLQITSPNTEVVVSSGSVAPGSTVGITGSTTINGPILTQTHYHWRNDDGTESGATSATGGSEDTVLLDVARNTTERVRLQVSNEGLTSSQATQYRLEYGTKITTCAAVSNWQDVDVGSAFTMSSTSQLVDGNDTTDIAISSGGVTNENSSFLTSNGGQKGDDSQTGSLTLSTTQYVEFEYALEATDQSGYDTTYCFRLTNAGTPIDAYDQYPELTTREKQDFFVQRGTEQISGTSITLTAGVDYIAPSATSSAFVRITNSQITGAGNNVSGTQSADDVTAYISDQSDITSDFTISRPGSATSNTRVDWEIVEYVGLAGADNEMIVRDVGAVTYGTSALFATGTAVSGVTDDSDVIVFITGQVHPDTGNGNYLGNLSTALWHATNSQPVFQRETSSGGASGVSYAVVEYTGLNWNVQRVEHAYVNDATTETESITAVSSLNRTFIHTQKRAGDVADNGLNDYGHQVWLSSIGAVSFRVDLIEGAGAGDATEHVSVAWVIENTQTGAGAMVVYRANGSVDANETVEPRTTSVSIGGVLSNTSNGSLFINNDSTGDGTAYPRPMLGATIASTTHYELFESDVGQTQEFRVEVVQWPVAQTAFVQNYYRFYVDNDALTPTDPWPAGASDLGDNTSITAVDEPLAEGEVARIRMSVRINNATLPESVQAFKLQYGRRVTTCSAISGWTDVGASGSGEIWRAHDGTPSDGTTLPSVLLTAVSDIEGTYEEDNSSAVNPASVDVGQDIEYDWVVEHNGALQRTDYCFRMIQNDDTSFVSYNNYPTLRTTGYTPVSANWRWYDDATSTTPTNPLSSENAAPIDVTNDNEIKLRVTVAEIENAAGNNVKFKLQYSENPNFTTVFDVASSTTCTESSLWCYADGGGADGAVIDSSVLSDADSCTGGSGSGCGTHNEGTTTPSTHTQPASSNMEFEFTIQQAGARVNTVYYFRLYDMANDDVVFASSTHPSLVTEGASLVLGSTGIASSTVISGVTTDVDTSANSIPFNSLPIDTDIVAAQRISVDTNGTEGYQILMYSTGNPASSDGSLIEDITASNTTPVAWVISCGIGAKSCLGYHTADGTLEGGSTRFAADDTYAAFEVIPREIAFSSQPTVNETTDLVYRIQASDAQEAGSYSTNIVFIAIPVF